MICFKSEFYFIQKRLRTGYDMISEIIKRKVRNIVTLSAVSTLRKIKI